MTFDATEIQPKPGDAQNGVYEGALTIITNDAEDPIVTVDLAGFWQPRPEAGREPNINEVWQLFGFGNEIEGLDFDNGGESDVLDFFDLFLPVDETEVMSPYWRIADGESSATITQIAAFHGPSGSSLGIHGPGNKGGANDIDFGSHTSTHNQRILPLEGGSFFTETFDRGDIPDGWAGSDVFGIEVAGLSTDPTLNPSGSGTVQQGQLDTRYPGYVVTNGVVTDPDGNVVPDGYTVRMFQAIDASGAAIENVYLGVMDYTGINYDYNDNMFIIEGVTPVGFGGELAISNLTAAAADERLVFSRIDNPANGAQSFADTQTFTLTNAGVGPLDIDGIDVTGPFEVVGQVPASLAPGASADITVQFTGTDPSDNNQAVLHEGNLTVNTGSGSREIALAGLAQIQSEGGEEPSVAQIVQAFGYSTDVQQGQLNGGGVVETVGDEVLLPYVQRLDGSAPVTVTQIAAYLSTGRVGHLNLHEIGSSALTELYTQGGNEAQTLLPTDGSGNPASAVIDRDAPFGLKVTVDNFPTFSAWTDPEINLRDPAFNLGPNNGGHYIRYFEAIDGNGEVIEGRYIAIQDYPGGENFDYNDHMYVIDNVQAYDPAGAEDADGDGIVDTLVTDTDSDGTVDFFDGDVTPPPAGQEPFGGTAPVLTETLTVEADTFDTGGQGVAWNDAEPGKDGGDTGARADSDVEIIGSDIAYVDAGEWVEYTIDVAEAGTFDLSVVAKAPTSGATIAVSLEDGSPLTTITLPDANGAGNNGFGGTSFGATPPQQIALEAGTQTLRFTFGGTIADNGYVLDMRSFTLDRIAEVTPNQQPVTSGITGAPQGAEDEAYSFDVSSFFSDPDAEDTLTFTASNLPAGLSISEAGVISGTVTGLDGDLTETVTVTASDGDLDVEASFDLTIADADDGGSPDGQAPFGGTAPVVGAGNAATIAALAYDEGGQGVAYEDDPGLAGGTNGGRSGSDVEITALGDVGWIADGEWLEYTVSVTSAGTYDVDFEAALGSSGGAQRSVSFAFDDGSGFGQTVSAEVDFTGGWTTFQAIEAGSVDLEAGTHVIRVTFKGGSQDLRSFSLEAQDPVEVNEAPVIAPLEANTVTEGEQVSIDLSGFISDPDLDDLTITATGLPAGLKMSEEGVITGSVLGVDADEVFTIEVSASDGDLSTTGSFDLTVENVLEDPIGQAGSVTFSQPDADTWLSVTFDEPLDNPSVVMGPVSFNGSDPSTMRVRNVTDTGFEFQLDEWDYLDGGHIEETVSWLAIESGVHQVNGQTIAAGVGSASETSSQIGFGHDFGSAPVVFGQVTSITDPDAVTDRITGTSGTGFTVALDDEEANGSAHGPEEFSWIAISEGGTASGGLVAGKTGNSVTHEPSTIGLGGDFVDAFAFIADMQTEDGGDPATIRWTDLTQGSATIFLEEEASNDSEIVHTTEQVGWLALNEDLIFA